MSEEEDPLDEERVDKGNMPIKEDLETIYAEGFAVVALPDDIMFAR